MEFLDLEMRPLQIQLVEKDFKPNETQLEERILILVRQDSSVVVVFYCLAPGA